MTVDRYNPYAPGAATPPPVLAGRDQWRTEFVEYLRAAEAGRPTRALIFSGLRGVGKTVLLTDLGDRARDRRWAATRLEAQPGLPLAGAVAGRVDSLLEELPGVTRRLAARLRALVDAVSVSVDSTGTVTVEATHAGGDDPAERRLQGSVRDLLVALGGAARRGKVGVALLLDELQEAAPADLRAIAVAVQAVASERLPLVVVGAGLPVLPAYLKGAVSYAERFQFAELGYLDADDAARALVEPADAQGVSYRPDALRLLVEASGGYPFLLQLYGRQAWAAAGGADVITAAHAERAELEVSKELHLGVFGGRWSQATNGERRYLVAMAVIGDGPVRSGDVARLLGTTTPAVSQYRQRLIDKGLIFGAEDRTVAFTLPHFARYVRRRALDDSLGLVPPGSLLAEAVSRLAE